MMNATDAVAVMRFLEKEAHDGEHTGEHQPCSTQKRKIAKYGMTVADNPLAPRAWLQHALEEVLDQAVYLKRAINEIDAMPRCDVWETFDRSDKSDDSITCMTVAGSGLADKFDESDHVVVMKVSP